MIVEDGAEADKLAVEAAALLDQLLAGAQEDLQQALQAGRANLAALLQPLLDELDLASKELAAVLDDPAARERVLQVGWVPLQGTCLATQVHTSSAPK